MPFIQCTREALLKPLQMVGGIVEGRQTLPILGNVLINKTGDSVTFTTTDLEIQVQTVAPVGVGADDVSTTLPSAKLIALLTALPSSGTEVSLEANERKVVLRANNSKFTLSPLPAEDYPELPTTETDITLELPAQTFKHLLQMVHFAMAQQDVRYYLNALLFIANNGYVRGVATDGHRMSCLEAKCDISVQEEVQAILPRKTVMQLMKLLPDSDEPVRISLSKTQARFQFGEIDFLSKLVEGKYPDYERVIPKNNDKSFLINREELIGAIKRAAILANERFKGLRWIITDGKLKIQSANSDMEEAIEELTIDYIGDELDLGFNVGYLLDVLNNLKNTEVCFSFSNAHGASLIKMPDSDQFCYVLMPMRI